jgi:AcrR family transcriptional regulator
MYRLVHLLLYHMVHYEGKMPRKKQRRNREQLLESCLAEFIRAGTLDLSLDSLAKAAGTSKRMLIHYFGCRDAIEEMAMSLLEDRLRARFQASAFPANAPLWSVVAALWEQTTSPESRGVLLLAMDLTRRSWSGSERARRFFEEQQRLWAKMLREFLPDPGAVETLLQLFQGAMLVYLVTGDKERGRRALDRFISTEAKADEETTERLLGKTRRSRGRSAKQ